MVGPADGTIKTVASECEVRLLMQQSGQTDNYRVR